MVLKPGIYTIRNDGRRIGRSLEELQDLTPKPVLLAPRESESEAHPWMIEAKGPDKPDQYILRARGDPTAEINNSVFALLTGDQAVQNEGWRIEAVPQHGENRYIITTLSQDRQGWVVPDQPEEQIKCRPLASTRSLPPQYFPNEVFEIVPVYRD